MHSSKYLSDLGPLCLYVVLGRGRVDGESVVRGALAGELVARAREAEGPHGPAAGRVGGAGETQDRLGHWVAWVLAVGWGEGGGHFYPLRIRIRVCMLVLPAQAGA